MNPTHETDRRDVCPYLPQRKQLPHDVPPWAPEHSRYFITINCHLRGTNTLGQEGCAEKLLESIQVYESLNKWRVFLMLIMPDHVHLIASFNHKLGIQPVVTSWKGYQTRQFGIKWQRDFFEHRIRNQAEFTKLYYYVLSNPVRKGLVADWKDWPYKHVCGVW